MNVHVQFLDSKNLEILENSIRKLRADELSSSTYCTAHLYFVCSLSIIFIKI